MKRHRTGPSSRSQERTLSARDRLCAAELRLTPSRVRVLEAVETLICPVTAADVFKKLIARDLHVGMGTIYRALRDLESAGLMMREWVPGLAGPKTAYSILYEHAAQARIPGHRLLCRCCRHSIAFHDTELPERLRRFTGRSGRVSDTQALTIEIDRCAHCGSADSQSDDTAERPPTDAGNYREPMHAHGGRSS